MPKHGETRAITPLNAETPRILQPALEDALWVTHHDILFMKSENKAHRVRIAPAEEDVRRHHKKAGITCDWIRGIASTRGSTRSVAHCPMHAIESERGDGGAKKGKTVPRPTWRGNR